MAETSNKLTYWRINSHSVGRGPLHERFEDAQSERERMLRNDPHDTITIHPPYQLTEKEFNELPEFQGY